MAKSLEKLYHDLVLQFHLPNLPQQGKFHILLDLVPNNPIIFQVIHHHPLRFYVVPFHVLFWQRDVLEQLKLLFEQ